MRIGELADTVGVNTKTVRYYESIGLMPAPDRTSSGYRDYGTDALERLHFIREAQASGLTLAEVQSILELKDAGRGTCEHTRQLLARHLDDIDEQIARLQQSRARILDLQDVAESLDPTDCTDPHRCQVIDAHQAR
ncbi:MAG: heavy metal-responsive transcriptional regulator [Acidimicrobiales bacterium]